MLNYFIFVTMIKNFSSFIEIQLTCNKLHIKYTI